MKLAPDRSATPGEAGTIGPPLRSRNFYRRPEGPRAVVDLQESPAVPPTDSGGDERAGLLVAGGLLIFLGWGLGVVANLLLHWAAGSGGMALVWMRISSTLGPYAWAVFGLGVVTGAVGVGLLLVGRATPRGRLVLPGADY